MYLKSMSVAAATAMTTAALLVDMHAVAATRDSAAATKLDCACKRYSGGGDCPAYLTIKGSKVSFGAFETSGTGGLKVGTYKGKPLYSSRIKTGTGQRMWVFAYVPRGLGKVEVTTDTFTPGKWLLLMSCH